MVFSIITLAVSIPVLATTTPLLATSMMQMQDEGQKKKDQGEQDIKTEKCHLFARASAKMGSERGKQFKDMIVVLDDGRLKLEKQQAAEHHRFTGYFLPFPEQSHDGLVSTINADNMLNWVYIDKNTYRLRYGVRADAQPHLTGPMSMLSTTGEEWRINFEGWEGFVAVEERAGEWTVGFDRDDNGLADKREGRSVVEIELVRSTLTTTVQVES